MIIANPIYDAVFKYLLEDAEIARELLGAILGEEIVHLDVRPQEYTSAKAVEGLRVFRMDFNAVVRLKSGETKKVLLELQKAKHLFDIMRFRRYLGEAYRKEDARQQVNEPKASYGVPLTIVTIYFLGIKLEHILIPVLKVGKVYCDAITGEALPGDVREPFVELLTHESFIIQIPRLEIRMKTRLEEALQVFSQQHTTDDVHKLRIKETPTNPLAVKMVDRLNRAAASEEVIRQMEFEDEIERTFDRELGKVWVKVEEAEKRGEEERKAKEEAIREKEAAFLVIAELQKQLQNRSNPADGNT